MALDKAKENLEDIKQNSKDYIDSNVAYFTLLGFKITTKASSFLIKVILLSLFLLLSLMFLSFALAFAIGNWVESNAIGFVAVGLLYMIISLFLFKKGGTLIDKPMIRTFSDIFFND